MKMIEPFWLSNNYWKLNQDTDKDGVPDYKDCKPFDPYKQHNRGYRIQKSVLTSVKNRFIKGESISSLSKELGIGKNVLGRILKRELTDLEYSKAAHSAPWPRVVGSVSSKKVILPEDVLAKTRDRIMRGESMNSLSRELGIRFSTLRGILDEGTPNADEILRVKSAVHKEREVDRREERGALYIGDRYVVPSIKRKFRSLVRKNPFSAQEFRKQMIEEEGEGFTRNTLGDLFNFEETDVMKTDHLGYDRKISIDRLSKYKKFLE